MNIVSTFKMDRMVAKQLILQNKLERKQKEEELQLKCEIEKERQKKLKIEAEERENIKLELRKRQEEAKQQKLKEEEEERLQKERQENDRIQKEKEKAFRRLEAERIEREREEQEKERVERQRRQNIQLEIDKLTEELLVEKQNIELTKQEEINIANRKQILNSKRKTEGEKMKELALETIMMMEHAVLNNIQENVEDSFISDILTFKANEKSELSNINKDEANVSQCVIEKQKKIEDIKNNIIKLKSQL